jgi:hypothetical protein
MSRWQSWTPPPPPGGFAGFAGAFPRGVEETGSQEHPARGVEPAKPAEPKNPSYCDPPHSLQNHPQNLQNPPNASEPPPDPTTCDPPTATFADDPRLAELLALLHLGRLAPRVGARLADLVRVNPPDALARLERAAVHLRLTGEHADHLLALAVAHGPTPAVDYAAEQETAA